MPTAIIAGMIGIKNIDNKVSNLTKNAVDDWYRIVCIITQDIVGLKININFLWKVNEIFLINYSMLSS